MSDLRAPLSNKEELPRYEHELLQIAEHVERWYDEESGVGNPTGTFAEYIGRLLSHIGRLESENERLKETALTEKERIHIILRIEHALRETPNCDMCPVILKKLRRGDSQ